MSDNINFDYKNLSPFKWFVLENFPFIEADFDALTEWQLFCKLGKEINKIIDSQNIVGEQAEILTNAFNNLKNYVDNYFNNLDVQDEINNKLNNMVQTGELQEIIATYLNSKAIFGFDNVESMKNATNLINGSYAQTLGFYEKNDGGKGLYKIREYTINDNIIDNSLILLNNGLIAELITTIIRPEQLGAYGDNINDDTEILQKTFNYAYTNKKNIILTKKYKISNDLEINRGINISGNTLNAGIYGNNNSIKIKGGSATSGYANNSDLMIFYSIYFYRVTVVLGDTITDWGTGITFNKCVFFGNNQPINGILIKNHSWIITINDCKIANFLNGIFFAFKNNDDTYVIDSGASIKITNTDIYNCNKGIYVKGSANDGYDIQIDTCDIEHNDYSIYAEDGRFNNIQCNNLHIEGNRIASIYTENTNVFVNNIWDFNSNPETFIANYISIGGRIIINSGRISFTNGKLIKNIGGKIYMNLNEIVIPNFLFNTPIATDDSDSFILVPDNYKFYIPDTIKNKEYANNDRINIGYIRKGSLNGLEIEMLFRQQVTTPTSDTNDLTVFFDSTLGSGNIVIPLSKYNSNIYLKITYEKGYYKVEGSATPDGGDAVLFSKIVYLNNDGDSVQRQISLRYRHNGEATLITKSMRESIINEKYLT